MFFAPKSLYINEGNAKSAFTSYELEGRVFFALATLFRKGCLRIFQPIEGTHRRDGVQVAEYVSIAFNAS